MILFFIHIAYLSLVNLFWVSHGFTTKTHTYNNNVYIYIVYGLWMAMDQNRDTLVAAPWTGRAPGGSLWVLLPSFHIDIVC